MKLMCNVNKGFYDLLIQKIMLLRDKRMFVFLDFVRERSFLILGTGAEDFWQGYETFFHYFVGVQKF